MEHYEEDVRGLVRFLADSPTAFHAVEGFARMLRSADTGSFRSGSTGISGRAETTIRCGMDPALPPSRSAPHWRIIVLKWRRPTATLPPSS